jgi:hypothetical protein
VSIFPCVRWNDLLLIKFPRVNLDFFICMYLHTKSSYFHIADSSRIRFHFLIAGYHSVLLSEPHNIRLFPIAKFLFVFESQASRAGAVPPTGRPRSWKRRGILKWGIDECCGAWREEHGITRPFANGITLKARRQY